MSAISDHLDLSFLLSVRFVVLTFSDAVAIEDWLGPWAGHQWEGKEGGCLDWAISRSRWPWASDVDLEESHGHGFAICVGHVVTALRSVSAMSAAVMMWARVHAEVHLPVDWKRTMHIRALLDLPSRMMRLSLKNGHPLILGIFGLNVVAYEWPEGIAQAVTGSPLCTAASVVDARFDFFRWSSLEAGLAAGGLTFALLGRCIRRCVIVRSPLQGEF